MMSNPEIPKPLPEAYIQEVEALQKNLASAEDKGALLQASFQRIREIADEVKEAEAEAYDQRVHQAAFQLAESLQGEVPDDASLLDSIGDFRNQMGHILFQLEQKEELADTHLGVQLELSDRAEECCKALIDQCYNAERLRIRLEQEPADVVVWLLSYVREYMHDMPHFEQHAHDFVMEVLMQLSDQEVIDAERRVAVGTAVQEHLSTNSLQSLPDDFVQKREELWGLLAQDDSITDRLKEGFAVLEEIADRVAAQEGEEYDMRIHRAARDFSQVFWAAFIRSHHHDITRTRAQIPVLTFLNRMSNFFPTDIALHDQERAQVEADFFNEVQGLDLDVMSRVEGEFVTFLRSQHSDASIQKEFASGDLEDVLQWLIGEAEMFFIIEGVDPELQQYLDEEYGEVIKQFLLAAYKHGLMIEPQYDRLLTHLSAMDFLDEEDDEG